tara:strand:- start:1857 stop:2042 length:186 start_codon:yes stop_codon:yes gene_type:complete
MKIMVSYEVTEDYIVDADTVEDALKEVNEIFEFKQSSQLDMLLQANIRYSVDIVKKYEVED